MSLADMRLRVLMIAACGAWMPAWVAAQPGTSPRVAVESFFKHPAYSSFKLSPSGRHVAGIVPVDGRNGLVVIELDTHKPEPPTTVRSSDIAWFEWVSDDRLVFTVMDIQVGLGEQRGSGLFTVNRDGSGFRILARPPTVAGQMVYRYTRFLAPLHDGSGDILVAANDNDQRFPDVYRLDTETGRKTLKSLDKPGNVLNWVADRKGDVRAAVAEDKEGGRQVFWRATGTAAWQLIGTYKLRDSSMMPITFDGDGSLVVASNVGRDTYALYRFDPVTKSLSEPLAAHPRIDLAGGLIYDRGKQQIVGVRYHDAKPGVAWFDDDWARIAATVDKMLPNRFNTLQRAEKGQRVLVFSSSDIDPGTYYILDLAQRRMEEIARVRPDIVSTAMPTRQPMTYTARDGLEIPGYLTLPKGAPERNLPLVLHVHGGPWVDGAQWGWRDEPAYLASLGYAVFEPAFRGSTSLGKKHFEASFRQWGRAMQDDLNDGVDFLVAKGIVDPKRVCIMGGSYGGYAVMMGLARDPDRWKCGINYAGVTDINLMYDVAWSDLSDSNFMRFSAKEMLGDPATDAAQLKATSPLEQVSRIKAPVLMAYGGRDFRVPLIHGTKMRDALESKGVPVEWVVYGDEGHGFLLEANRFDFYRRVGAFLERSIGK